jgi:hypothetical protein
MKNKSPSSAAPLLAAVLIVGGLLLAGYAAGYFWLGELQVSTGAIQVINGKRYSEGSLCRRNYTTQWETLLFLPAGKVESWRRGAEVELTWGINE